MDGIKTRGPLYIVIVQSRIFSQIVFDISLKSLLKSGLVKLRNFACLFCAATGHLLHKWIEKILKFRKNIYNMNDIGFIFILVCYTFLCKLQDTDNEMRI